MFALRTPGPKGRTGGISKGSEYGGSSKLSNFLARTTAIGLSVGLVAGAVLFSLPGQDAAAKPLRPGSMWRQAAAGADDGLDGLHYVAATETTVAGFDVASIDSAPRTATVSHSLRVGRGDTLMKLLVAAGVARREAHDAIVALREFYDPRRLRPGQEIRVTLAEGADDGGADGRLLALGLQPNAAEHADAAGAGGDSAAASAPACAATAARPFSKAINVSIPSPAPAPKSR